MSNTAHLKFRKRITLSNYHYWLQRALMATFGDALILDGAATDNGVNVRTETGSCLLQFWYESKGHISVDHRHGAVGYMVSNAMLAWLARHLNGRVLETGTGDYLDLTREYPLYFMDVVRREYEHLVEFRTKNPRKGADPMPTLDAWAENHKVLEGHHFTGKFARFWERVGVPIEQEPKPWDAMACERCCICRTPTRWWTKLPDRKPGEQVALCEGCALTATPATIPTKRAWCDKERDLNPRPYWGRSPWTFQGKDPS